jgi:uncharacterized membrane protein
MAYLPTSAEQEARRRIGLRVAGTVLVLLGIVAVAYGIGSLNDTPPTPSDFNDQMVSAVNNGSSFTGMFMLAVGAIVMLAGFAMITSGFSRPEGADEVSAAGSAASSRAGGAALGGGKAVTCAACGLLNEPGARTCENCGEPLASA